MAPTVVKIELFGVIRDLVKEGIVDIELPDGRGVTFRDIMGQLAERFGPQFRERLFDERGLSSFVKVYCNGEAIKDLDKELPSAEEAVIRVIVFAAAGGG